MAVTLTPSGTRGRAMPGPKWLIKAFSGMPIALQRLTGGRLKMNGHPLLLLTTVGAKSGQERTSMVAQFPEADGATLIVASFGGAAKHPAWYFNLAKHPDQVWMAQDGKRVRVTPRSLAGDERATAWQRITSIAPGFAEYQRHTDREIPVIRLTPSA